MTILEVNDLSIQYSTGSGTLNTVSNASLSIHQGLTLGVVGESGSGKSQMALALMGLLDANAKISGQVMFDGQSILELKDTQRRKINGNRMAMVFQAPMRSLNPYLSIATQMTEVLIVHKQSSYKNALAKAIELLIECGIEDAAERIHGYPHEFSGGMRQRILIATALLCRPAVLIADEPTTALDVSMQAQILNLLKRLQRQYQMALLVITHDFGVVAELCDQVMVMYGGQVMECASVNELLQVPVHPYTKGLLASVPRLKKSTANLYSMPGDPVDPLDLPVGCPFEPRCAQRVSECKTTRPGRYAYKNDHEVYCHVST